MADGLAVAREARRAVGQVALVLLLADREAEVSPVARQWMHSRHWGENSVTTWSPTASELTPSPIFSTTPAPSWPSTVGA